MNLLTPSLNGLLELISLKTGLFKQNQSTGVILQLSHPATSCFLFPLNVLEQYKDFADSAEVGERNVCAYWISTQNKGWVEFIDKANS